MLWRVVAMREDGSYEEGFYSLFDQDRRLRLQRIEGSPPLRDALLGIDAVRRLARFSHGFYKVHERDGQAWVTDLRMGQEPHYAFSFLVAHREGDAWTPLPPQNLGSRGDTRRGLAWLWERLRGHEMPPPV